MRNFLFTLIIFSLLIISSCFEKQEVSHKQNFNSLELREAGKSCIHEIFNPGTCFNGQFIQNIQLAQYPGCNFLIKLDYIYCFGGGGVVALHLGNFEILDHDCPQFNNDVNTAIGNNTIEQFWFNFNVEVWRVMTNYCLNTFSPNTYAVLKFEYLIAECTKTCTVEINRQGGFTALVPVEIRCSSECCRRRTDYISVNGEWIVDYHIVEVVGNSCSEPIASCPLNTVSSTECTFQCDILHEF